jgi:hypothetical protein
VLDRFLGYCVKPTLSLKSPDVLAKSRTEQFRDQLREGKEWSEDLSTMLDILCDGLSGGSPIWPD